MKNKVCIIIPMYQLRLSHYEKISLAQIFKVLKNFQIFVVSPEKLKGKIEDFFLKLNYLPHFEFFSDKFFFSITDYNRLLLSKQFYLRFSHFKFMLITHLDSFVFRDELEYWCEKGYTSIGAPFFTLIGPPFFRRSKLTQGNGGFCLRNIDQCLKVLKKKEKFYKIFSKIMIAKNLKKKIYLLFYELIFIIYRYFNIFNFNEDFFWSTVVPAKFDDFLKPSISKAIKFSFEVNPDVFFKINRKRLPFGCHGWWRYNFQFWKPIIEDEGYELNGS